MIGTGLWAGYLFLVSIQDVRKRSVATRRIMGGVGLAILLCTIDCTLGEGNISDRLLGMAPGIVLGIVAVLTEKAGEADGVLLSATGLVLGARPTVIVFFVSMWMIFAAGIVLLLLKKGGRNYRIPYLPFLLAGVILSVTMGGM